MMDFKAIAVSEPSLCFSIIILACYLCFNEATGFFLDWQGKYVNRKKKTVTWLDEVEATAEQILPSAVNDETDITCPYEYILSIYGRNHFKRFIDYLDLALKDTDPLRYELALELMDAVHFGAILVDDIADGSNLRKGKKAAHLIFGRSETINRAYLRIFEVLAKFSIRYPALLPLILNDITEIHEGQDISLVWRRDGLPTSFDRTMAISEYRRSSSLKTGALFRLLGHLVYGSTEKDTLMSQVGWYCHLQNDCKNVFSSDVIHAKGAMAEDLRNGEYSFPIILGLFGNHNVSRAVKSAIESGGLPGEERDDMLCKGVAALQTTGVRDVCLSELESLKNALADFSFLWGRQEKMTLKEQS